MEENLKLIECPRDALQGLPRFIPTALKITYLNLLLQAGFDTLDFGSFVSPKAIPQMADTIEVLAGLQLTSTKLLAIIANVRGAEQASQHPEIDYMGFPLSVSETFQQRNTGAGRVQGLDTVARSLEIAGNAGKELVVYLSMAFGNPYGDAYSSEIVSDYAAKLQQMGVNIISLSDTVGLADAALIRQLGEQIIHQFPTVEIGMHLHSNAAETGLKMNAALATGCRRLDTALGGLGGCPMAEDELVGNIATEALIEVASAAGFTTRLNLGKLQEASAVLQQILQV